MHVYMCKYMHVYIYIYTSYAKRLRNRHAGTQQAGVIPVGGDKILFCYFGQAKP